MVMPPPEVWKNGRSFSILFQSVSISTTSPTTDKAWVQQDAAQVPQVAQSE
jgi:hypothetical protein